jgi:hypothetical protein
MSDWSSPRLQNSARGVAIVQDKGPLPGKNGRKRKARTPAAVGSEIAAIYPGAPDRTELNFTPKNTPKNS